MNYENISIDEHCCLNCEYWIINIQMFNPADGVICRKDGEHTAPENCCNLFKQDPIIYQSLSGGGYSADEGPNGRIYRRRRKLGFYKQWLNKQIY